jgi:hypothetical protein
MTLAGLIERLGTIEAVAAVVIVVLLSLPARRVRLGRLEWATKQPVQDRKAA